MQKNQITGQPVSYLSDLSHMIGEDDHEIEWCKKSQKLQARRWRKILRD